ncbi:diacylglycerol kinase [Candidatus Regiella insecticola]|uniref:diacylglycerol kinase n=1 Tax=Candidatus Regiella insecticola TaxID=138073 RepID=UPI0005C53845|nr:diacylglycerol kinase [Candidatus Regiella insecticola]
MDKNKKTGLTRLYHASQYSLKGLLAVWKNEAAFRQETTVAIIAIILAYCLDFTTIERILLIGSIVLVIIVEIINSAIETAIDRIGSEQHPLSGQAKDIASAAVFITIVMAFFVWISILI